MLDNIKRTVAAFKPLMTTEPKPQTPKCNCGLGMLPFDDGKHLGNCPCHPSQSKPQTPLTDALEVPFANLKYVGGGYYRENLPKGEVARVIHGEQMLERVKALELKPQEAERQRDEAHKNCIKQLDWEQLRAERDQLIKVVDAYNKAGECCHGFSYNEHCSRCKADRAHALLPHVIAKKGNKQLTEKDLTP